MRLLTSLLIALIGVAAQAARPLHSPWPDTTIARFDRLFVIAAVLYLPLLWRAVADWTRLRACVSQARDWKAWLALALAMFAAWFALLPAVQ
jgi:hypothetical protein